MRHPVVFMARGIVPLILLLVEQVVKRLIRPICHSFGLAVKSDSGFTSREVRTEDFLELPKFLVLAVPDYLFRRSAVVALGRSELHLGQELLLAFVGCMSGGLLG